MIDPLERWQALGLPDKPDYAGLLTYSGLPYTQDPRELAGVDVAIVGAPSTISSPIGPGRVSGRVRFVPRVARPARTSRRRSTGHRRCASSTTATRRSCPPTLPGRMPRSSVSSRRSARARRVPFVLGGDHSIAEPDIRAVSSVHGPVGLVHFDTHTDTGEEVFGVEVSHGTPMFRLVRDGHVIGARYAQIGLRGYWPGEAEFEWQADQGITSFFMHDVRERGIREIVEERDR